jgi:hypothetical protein
MQLLTPAQMFRRLRFGKPVEWPEDDRYINDLDSFIPVSREDKGLRVRHLDGVPWYDAPVPPKRHRCFAQTIGEESDLIGTHTTIERCPCGGINMIRWSDIAIGRPGSFDHWMERNTR